MCGPSSGLKALNTTVKGALTSAQSEASTIFGAANTIFNNLIGPLQAIVNGGPSQAGFSAAELSAKNAAAVQAGATMARNLAGAAGSSAAAVGGGNTATPGTILSAELGAKTAAAQETAATENQIQSENYETGRQNFWKAEGSEQNLTNVFNPATASESNVNAAAKNAVDTQKEIDKQNNWWQPMVTAAIGGAAKAGMAFATGGASVAADAAMSGGSAISGMSGSDQEAGS